MAKPVIEKDEFYEKDGLRILKDAFGGDIEIVKGVSDVGEWEVLEEDAGEQVEWTTTPILVGTYDSSRTIDVPMDDGEVKATWLYTFTDANLGPRMAFWGTFQLDRAMSQVEIGRQVYIEWKGKSEQAKGGRTLNKFVVLVKRT